MYAGKDIPVVIYAGMDTPTVIDQHGRCVIYAGMDTRIVMLTSMDDA